MLRYLLLFYLIPCLGNDYAPQESLEKLYAVHATHILPKTGVLRAGFQKKVFKEDLAQHLYPDLRHTVHFSIGELVRPIQVGDKIYNWEECPYAIVIPLKTLMPQVISLNCYDLFTLGSVSLDRKEVTLVIPADQLSSLPEHHRFAVLCYDPKSTTLRQAVEEVIELKEGWHVRMVDNHSEDDLGPAFLEGTEIDINQSLFFSFLKNAYPHISIVGLRWRPFEGEGYLFGLIEMQAAPLIQSFLAPTFPAESQVFDYKDLEKRVFELYETAAKVDHFVHSSPYLLPQKLEYESKREQLESWLNILTIELEISRVAQKTLRGASPKLWERIDDCRHSLHALRNLVWEERAHLADTLPQAA